MSFENQLLILDHDFDLPVASMDQRERLLLMNAWEKFIYIATSFSNFNLEDKEFQVVKAELSELKQARGGAESDDDLLGQLKSKYRARLYVEEIKSIIDSLLKNQIIISPEGLSIVNACFESGLNVSEENPLFGLCSKIREGFGYFFESDFTNFNFNEGLDDDVISSLLDVRADYDSFMYYTASYRYTQYLFRIQTYISNQISSLIIEKHLSGVGEKKASEDPSSSKRRKKPKNKELADPDKFFHRPKKAKGNFVKKYIDDKLLRSCLINSMTEGKKAPDPNIVNFYLTQVGLYKDKSSKFKEALNKLIADSNDDSLKPFYSSLLKMEIILSRYVREGLTNVNYLDVHKIEIVLLFLDILNLFSRLTSPFDKYTFFGDVFAMYLMLSSAVLRINEIDRVFLEDFLNKCLESFSELLVSDRFESAFKRFNCVDGELETFRMMVRYGLSKDTEHLDLEGDNVLEFKARFLNLLSVTQIKLGFVD